MKLKKSNKRGSLAISQIIILLLGTIAISYVVGNIGFVSAQTPGAEFTYNGIDYRVESSTKIIQKNGAAQFRRNIANPCKTKWFWDVDGDGDWGSVEQNRLNGGQSVCMVEGFVSAAETAQVPAAPVQDISPEEETCLERGGDLIRSGSSCEECSGRIETAPDGSCCLGVCKESQDTTPGEGLPPVNDQPAATAVLPAAAAAAEAARQILEDTREGGSVGSKDGEESPATPPASTGNEPPTKDEVDPDAGKKFFESAFVSLAWIAGSVGAAFGVHAGVTWVLEQIGAEEAFTEATAAGLAWGVGVGGSAFGLFKEGGLLAFANTGAALAWSIGIGVVIAGIAFLIAYQETDEITVNFECLPWQPETRGEKCSECGNDDLPCSEYQCRSLGQACELLNEEDSGEAVCVWKNPNDISYPIIQPWEEALLEDYSYSPDNAISPPDRGAKIEYIPSADGCVPSFTPVSFGIELDEPGVCKIDAVRKPTFDEMDFFMSNGFYKTEHSYALNVPGLEALQEEGINVDSGEMELYMRCQDGNGNTDTASFVFTMCIDPLPDETQPSIVATNLLNGMPIAFNTSSVYIETYINEPVRECRWSHNRLDTFSSMTETMDCSRGNENRDMNAQGLYTCDTTLTGIKKDIKNDFYFRCEDKAGNVNEESFKFTIKGTQPLVIDSVTPNETTIKGSTDTIEVKLRAQTSAGYDRGAATCSYSTTGNVGDYRRFLETGTHTHSQDLSLAGGPYTYYVRCVDLGGNANVKTVNFDVETDLSAPKVVRAYHEETSLKIITDEKAECVYDIVSCNYVFDDGLQMTTINDNLHFTEWNTETNFYIKCKDQFTNRPAPNSCSIIVRPT